MRANDMAQHDKRVLLVDDEDRFLRMLALACEELCDVRTALCINTAIQALQTMQFDVLVTDYHLATEKGTRLLELAHRCDPPMYRVLCSGDFEAAAHAPGAELADRVIDKREILAFLEGDLPGRIDR
jgi:ActR/RegA family two-component response regulator